MARDFRPVEQTLRNWVKAAKHGKLNAPGIPIAAGVLYPAFGLLLSPIFTAAAMAIKMSSVSVVTNTLRLRRVRLD